MSTYPTCSECGKILWELAEREGKMCEKCQKENWRNQKQMDKLYFKAIIKIELDEDALSDWRGVGYQDTAIIHEICDELMGKGQPHLIGVNMPEFSNCEVKK